MSRLERQNIVDLQYGDLAGRKSDGSLVYYNFNGGGSASQDLGQVLDQGNSTGGVDISISDGDAIVLDNNSKLKKGTIDAALGGQGGISQICSIDYELKWEAGRLYVMNGGGLTIRQSLYNFTTAPAISDDDTKGYLVGSIWSLDDLTNYVCSDNSTGAAVWNIIPSPSPSQFAVLGVTTEQGPFSTGGTSSYIRLPFVGTGNINGIMGTASGGEFGVKLGLRTHAYSVNATANVEIGNNKVASIKLEMEVGGFLSLTEARSRTSNATPAVGGFCHTEWIIVPSDITNDYESVYLTAANLSNSGDISIDICRIVVTDLGLYVP
jgi:hypothetical protein